MHRKGINQKLYSLFKQNNEGEKIIKFFKYLLNINNLDNQNNMEEKEKIYVVQPGHYVENSTKDSDTKKIIRILGPNPDREGHWLTDDNKSISEFLLESDYTALDTASTDGSKNKKKKNIFADFETVNIEEQPIEQNQQVIVQETTQELPKQIHQHEQPIEKKQEDSIYISKTKGNIELGFDISVIEKLNIDNINKKKKEQLGVEHGIPKPTVKVELPIAFDYDLEKLRATIELLDLNETEIINYIVSKIDISQIHLVLFTEVQKILRGDSSNLGIDAIQETTKILRAESKPLIDKANDEIVSKVIEESTDDNKPEFAVQRRNQEEIQNVDVEESLLPEKVNELKNQNLEVEIDSIQSYINNNFK